MKKNVKRMSNVFALSALASVGLGFGSDIAHASGVGRAVGSMRNMNTVSNTLRRGSTISNISSTGGSIRPNLSDLNQRLSNLEHQRATENARNKHPFNKAVMIAGVTSSATLVAGLVGGIIQQFNFRDLAEKQAARDQLVQEDLTKKRREFEDNEVKEAEQYIIDYYDKNFGIDITK